MYPTTHAQNFDISSQRSQNTVWSTPEHGNLGTKSRERSGTRVCAPIRIIPIDRAVLLAMASSGGGGLNLGQKLGQGFQLGGIGQQQGMDSDNVYWVSNSCSTYL